MSLKELSFDIDYILQYLFEKGPVEHDFPVSVLHELFRRSTASLASQPSLLNLSGPINVCGDIHGQYADLLNIFEKCGWPFETRYLFLGDYVDRGRNSLEVLVLLLACQLRFPDNVFLLRGNHESRSVNKTYGFLSELRARYPQGNTWETIMDAASQVFGNLPVAALVCNRMLCLHGGLSPSLNSLADIKNIKKGEEFPQGLLEDLLWADPTPCGGSYTANDNRGCSFHFGDTAITEQFKTLNIGMIIRGHQAVETGMEFSNKNRVLTLFSAPGYEETYFNRAAVMHISRERVITFTHLSEQKMRKEINKYLPQTD